MKSVRVILEQLVYIIERRKQYPAWRDPSWMDSDLRLIEGAGPCPQEGESDLSQDANEESAEEDSGWWSDGIRQFEEDMGVPPQINPQTPERDQDEPPALSDTESDSEEEEDGAYGHKQAARSTIKFFPTKGKGRSSC